MLLKCLILHPHCLVWEDGSYEFVSDAALFLDLHLQFVVTLWMAKLPSIICSPFKESSNKGRW